MRDRFDTQLAELHQELILMGALCEEAISAAVSGLTDYDAARMEQVRMTERQIDRKEREIEALCLKLLLHQQPVARDLRTVSSALKMISDMERIGDQAADIAEIIGFIKNKSAESRVHIDEMARAVIRMVTQSVTSFVNKDLELARQTMAADDEVDERFQQIKGELIELIANRGDSELCLDLLMIAKYLERIGDHAVNIAEWVEFSVTGIHSEA